MLPDISSYDSYDDLLTVSFYFTWLFVWDDLTDCNDTSSSPDGLATDFERACAFREETIRLARECIVGPACDNDDDDIADSESIDDNGHERGGATKVRRQVEEQNLTGSELILHEFGKRVRKSRLNKAQRDRVFLETVRFIKGSETEQAQRLAGYLPKNTEEYFDLRLCSGAVWPCFLLLE